MWYSSSFVHNTVRLLYSRLFDLHTREKYLAICLLVIKQIIFFSYVGLIIKPPCVKYFFFFLPTLYPLGYLSFTALSFT